MCQVLQVNSDEKLPEADALHSSKAARLLHVSYDPNYHENLPFRKCHLHENPSAFADKCPKRTRPLFGEVKIVM